MKKLLSILIVLWGGGALGVWYWNDARGQRIAHRTVRVGRGDLLATIDATGTIEPVEVVDVGAQIAGMIESFGEDPREPGRPISYGTPVEQGTVLAHLEDSLYKARSDQARASLGRAQADVLQAQAKLKQAERDLERVKKLQARSMVSAQDYDAALANFEAAEANLAVSRSSVDVAEANLAEAGVNLGHATIRSPVKGVILDRRVNIGQTVVAALNAPSLFLIAKDLSRLEIWASVNETDVGAIRVGQVVRFTVGAFPGETFRGEVSQIRLNASMTQGVVTYTVVVDVDNADGKLLPYLTARLQFEVAEREAVLLVPNAALRWRPRPEHAVPEARARLAELTGRRADAPAGGGRRMGDGPAPATLWVAQDDLVRPVEVKAGLTDGLMTEIDGEGLEEGSEVVVGQIHRDDEGASASPFLPQLKNDKAKR